MRDMKPEEPAGARTPATKPIVEFAGETRAAQLDRAIEDLVGKAMAPQKDRLVADELHHLINEKARLLSGASGRRRRRS
jgi:hypothetical protein